MKPAIIFLCLCFLLLNGNDLVGKGMLHNGIAYPQVQHIGKNGQVACAVNPGHDTVKQDCDKQQEWLVCGDVEEEDTNDFSARKYRLLSAGNAIVRSFFDIGHHHRIKALQAAYKVSSHRYTIQGVLRI